MGTGTSKTMRSSCFTTSTARAGIAKALALPAGWPAPLQERGHLPGPAYTSPCQLRQTPGSSLTACSVRLGGTSRTSPRCPPEEPAADGRADYVLKNQRTQPLAPIETKRFSIDPYSAKERAREYAVNLGAPFVILSNGREHYFWEYETGDARPIVGLPSRADLERRANLRQHRRGSLAATLRAIPYPTTSGSRARKFKPTLTKSGASAPPMMPSSLVFAGCYSKGRPARARRSPSRC